MYPLAHFLLDLKDERSRTKSSLDADPFPLFTICYALAHFLLVHLLLVKLSRKLGLGLSLDVFEGGKVVAECVLLLPEGVTEMLPQRHEGRPHNAV